MIRRRGANVCCAFSAGRQIEFIARRLEAERWTPPHLAVVLFLEHTLDGTRYTSRRGSDEKYGRAMRIVRDLVNHKAEPRLRLPMRFFVPGKPRVPQLSAVDLAKIFLSKLWWKGTRTDRLQLLKALRPLSTSLKS